MRRRPVFTIVAKRAPVWAIQFPALALPAKAELFCMLVSFLAARLAACPCVLSDQLLQKCTLMNTREPARVLQTFSWLCKLLETSTTTSSVNHWAITPRPLPVVSFRVARAVGKEPQLTENARSVVTGVLEATCESAEAVRIYASTTQYRLLQSTPETESRVNWFILWVKREAH